MSRGAAPSRTAGVGRVIGSGPSFARGSVTTGGIIRSHQRAACFRILRWPPTGPGVAARPEAPPGEERRDGWEPAKRRGVGEDWRRQGCGTAPGRPGSGPGSLAPAAGPAPPVPPARAPTPDPGPDRLWPEASGQTARSRRDARHEPHSSSPAAPCLPAAGRRDDTAPAAGDRATASDSIRSKHAGVGRAGGPGV